MTSPPLAVHNAHQMLASMLAARNRTLPSPIPTFIPPECGDCVMRWLQAVLSTHGPGGWTMNFDCGPTASDTVEDELGLQPGTAKVGMEVCGTFDHSQLTTALHPVYRSAKKIVLERPSRTESKGFR